MDLDAPICLCFDVSRRKIIRFIKVDKPRRASQLSECFGAGTGCGWCRQILEQLHRQHSASTKLTSHSSATTPSAIGAIDKQLDSLDPQQYQAARQAYRDKKRAQAQVASDDDASQARDQPDPAS